MNNADILNQSEKGEAILQYLRDHPELSRGLSCMGHPNDLEARRMLLSTIDIPKAQRSYEVFCILLHCSGSRVLMPSFDELYLQLSQNNPERIYMIRERFRKILGEFIEE